MRKVPYVFLFTFMGLSYYLMEIVWRGYSHISMFLLGGVIGILIGLLNEHGLTWDMYFEKQLLLGLCIVLPLEFLTGVFLHFVLRIQPPVWDYSQLPLNLYGQVSLAFAPVFLVPIAIAILADDFFRYILMEGRRPSYRFYLKEKFLKK